MDIIPYIKTNWKDHIIDIETEQVIQEGTRFTASRANNIEEGIFNAYGYLGGFGEEITKIRIQLEMLGRVPTNNGTFFDTLEDGENNTKALKLYTQSAVLQNALGVGATELVVDDTSAFAVGQEISLVDEEQFESKKILSIGDNTITVSALEKPFKKGAIVMRSNSVIKNNKLIYGKWGNYKIDVREVV